MFCIAPEFSLRKASRTDLRSSTSEYYIYDGDHIVADLDVSGQPIRTYTWGAGIDNLISFTDHSTDTTYYAVKDHLNSVIALVNEQGEIVESYTYDAYGNTKIYDGEGNRLSASAVGNRYMFQGREYDTETGLYYFRARWYDPDTGRWCSKDPLGIAGGLNLYEAFGNNAVNFIDPFGMFPVWKVIKRVFKPTPLSDPTYCSSCQSWACNGSCILPDPESKNE